MKRPYAYQTVGGKRVQVACDYSLNTPRSSGVSFRLARYDRALPLTVDPVLVYSTFVGGQSYATTVAADGSGATYLGGDTAVASFPTTTGAFDTTYNGNEDIYIAKLNASGSALVYSTFIGGTGSDHVGEFVVDS